jgi:serine protease Do
VLNNKENGGTKRANTPFFHSSLRFGVYMNIYQLPKKQRAAWGSCLGVLFLSIALLVPDFFGAGTSPEAALPADQAAQLPSFAEVARNSMPAVVNIATSQTAERRSRQRQFPFPMPGPGPFGEEDPFEEFFRRFFGDRPPPGPRRSLGSGFIISPDGYIVTNNHVVDKADKITVRLSGPREEEYEAKVVGTDEQTDLALIKIDASRSLPTVSLGKSAELQVGDWVLAIGNPFGLEQTVTAGIVSAKGRIIGAGPYDDFIQTDASINPGHSGGPLLNLQGEVVGVNSAIFSQTGGNIGIGFAIPIDLGKSIISQLRETGTVTRGWLGVMIQAVTSELAKSFGLEEARGALIAEVTEGSPADKAGLERGDIITDFNGTAIDDSRELPALVAQTPVGEKAAVTVLRGGKEQTFTVTLGKLPEQQAMAGRGETGEEGWGFAVADLSPEIASRLQLDPDQRGVVVTEVEPGSSAEAGGLQAGDVIEEVNRRPVKSVEEFTKALADAQKQETLLLLVRRGTFSSFFALQKEE